MTTEYSQFINEQGLLSGLQDRADTISTTELYPIIDELCSFYAELKKAQATRSKIFQPSGEWDDYLKQQKEIYRPLLEFRHADAGSLLKNFWRNELSPVVKQYFNYHQLCQDPVARNKFIELMAHDYMVWHNLEGLSVDELKIPLIGNPWGYEINNELVAPKALRYHLLASQIYSLVSDLDKPVVAEIGAGYGGTAFYLLRGERPITYINFDLPEVLTISAYYLKRSLPHRRIKLWQSNSDSFLDDIREYDVLLMPNWMLESLQESSVDVFLNTFSLSEMPFEVIENYMAHIERACRHYFLYNNMDRNGVFNRGFERVPCSSYPIQKTKFKQLYKRYDMFQQLHYGRNGDYREVLLQRV